jgi:hypothetical protein
MHLFEGNEKQCFLECDIYLFIFTTDLGRCPSSDIERYKSGGLPLAPPSKTYTATLIKGLVEGNQLDEVEAANYINSAAARAL